MAQHGPLLTEPKALPTGGAFVMLEVNRMIDEQIDKLGRKLSPSGQAILGTVAAVLALLIGLIATLLGPVPSPDQTPAPAPTASIAVNLASPPTTATLAQMTNVPPGEQPQEQPNGDSPGNVPDVYPQQSHQVAVDGFGAGNLTFVNTDHLRRANPWTAAQAVAYALGQAVHPDKNYFRRCEHAVAWYYGWGGSGYGSAKEHAYAVPKSLRYKIPSNASAIPAGALVYWFDGTWGHVALSVGAGKVASNDIVSAGRIDVVPLSRFAQKWGYVPDFWTLPDWPPAFGKNPNPAPKVVETPAKPTKPTVNLRNIDRAARTHGDAPGVKRFRQNLGMQPTTHFGHRVLTRYREWQRELGYRGPEADGIPGCKSSKRLAKKGPNHFKVKCP